MIADLYRAVGVGVTAGLVASVVLIWFGRVTGLCG